MEDCNIALLTEDILKACQALERDLRRLRRRLNRCPACQGAYCPVLLELAPAVSTALQALSAAWGLTDDDL